MDNVYNWDEWEKTFFHLAQSLESFFEMLLRFGKPLPVQSALAKKNLPIEKYFDTLNEFLVAEWILNACSKILMLQKLINYFENIENLYEFIPKSSHCKCTG